MDATTVTTDKAVAVDTLGRRIMPRRFRPLAERRRIAQEALQPGVSVAEIARRLRIPLDAGPGFRSMPGQRSGACRATIPLHVGPGV